MGILNAHPRALLSEPSTVQNPPKHPKKPQTNTKKSLEIDYQRYHNIHYTSINWLTLKAATEKLAVLNTSCLYKNTMDPLITLITKQPPEDKNNTQQMENLQHRGCPKSKTNVESEPKPQPRNGRGVSNLTHLTHFPAALSWGKGDMGGPSSLHGKAFINSFIKAFLNAQMWLGPTCLLLQLREPLGCS